MNKTIFIAAGLLSFAPLVAACQPDEGSPAAWSGRWTGVEGNYLDITPVGKSYRVTIQSLDGLGTYEGKEDGGTILFTRDDIQETLRPGTGKETGMKWLLEKHDCLVVKNGEGYCRD